MSVINDNWPSLLAVKNASGALLVDGEAVEVSSWTWSADRMGDSVVSGRIEWRGNIDSYLVRGLYVELRGVKYYLDTAPESTKSVSTKGMWEYSVTFREETRMILSNSYFLDVLPAGLDRYVGGGTSLVMAGDLAEFVGRLNASLAYRELGITVSIEPGITTSDETLSVADKTYFEVLQEAFSLWGVPFWIDGRTVVFGYGSGTLPGVFAYGDGLTSIKRGTSSDPYYTAVIPRGSGENLPQYYPNESEKGSLTVDGNRSDLILQVSDMNRLASLCSAGDDLVFGIPEFDLLTDSACYMYPEYMFLPLEPSRPTDPDASDTGDYYFYTLKSGAVRYEGTRTRTVDGVKKTSSLSGFSVRVTFHSPFSGRCSFGFALTPATPTNQWYDVYAFDAEKWQGTKLGSAKISQANDLSVKKASWTADVVQGSNSFIFKFGTPIGSEGYFGIGTQPWTYMDSLLLKGADGVYRDIEDYGLSVVSGTPAEGDHLSVKQSLERIDTSDVLLPPVYRSSGGKTRLYKALNDTHKDAEGNYYSFGNTWEASCPREAIVDFDIKPTIEGMTNTDKNRIDQLAADCLFDLTDSRSLSEGSSGDYLHPRFAAKIRKTATDTGAFNLFASAIESDEMRIVMTSGSCCGCSFKVLVTEKGNRNPIKTGDDGLPVRDADGNIAVYTDYDADNSDTSLQDTWILLEKDSDTFGELMPDYQSKLYPLAGDSFVITGISLPEAYITAAEEKLRLAALDWLSENNAYKHTLSVESSRISLANCDERCTGITESSAVYVRYEDTNYLQYISNLSVSRSGDALPEVKMSLVGEIKESQSSLARAISEVKDDILNTRNALQDVETIGSGYFLRKDRDDEAAGELIFRKGSRFGSFVQGLPGAGGCVSVGDDGSTTAEFDKLVVRKDARFSQVSVMETKALSGNYILSPAGARILTVETDSDGNYRCAIETIGADGKGVDNPFSADDLVLCSSSDGSGQTYWWRRCLETGADYIVLSSSDCASDSSVPVAGDSCVVLGNVTDAERQNAIYVESFGVRAPRVTLFSGIDTYSTSGHDGVCFAIDELGEAVMYAYGKFFFGDRDLTDSDAQFITFQQAEGDTRKKLRISADVQIGAGSSGLTNLSEWSEKQSQIDNADTKADTAMYIADAANDKATAAQTAATEAKASADAAQTVADDAKARVDAIDDDGIITPSEKLALKQELSLMDSDAQEISKNVKLYELESETALYSAYQNAYLAYYDKLNKICTTEGDVASTGLSDLQDDYYSARSEILKAIAVAAEKKAADAAVLANNAITTAQGAQDYIDSTISPQIAEINDRLDGVVTSWFYAYSPTLENEPASLWTTDEDKANHVGDTFTNTQEYVDDETTPDAGKSWRWVKNEDGTYGWSRISDSDAAKALELAQKAKDTADGKRRVFYTEPYGPYDAGDLWVQGETGDILYCATARESGFYNTDWAKASKYTDDTAADAAQTAAGLAQAAADTALEAADAAAKDAADAMSVAEAAQTEALEASGRLDNLADDGIISPVEKTYLYQMLADINEEYNDINADIIRYGLSGTAEDSDYSFAYGLAVEALGKYTADMTSDSVKEADYDYIEQYFNARTTILDYIAQTAKKLADDAKAAADTAQTAADDAAVKADAAAAAAAAAKATAETAEANIGKLDEDQYLTTPEKRTLRQMMLAISQQKGTSEIFSGTITQELMSGSSGTDWTLVTEDIAAESSDLEPYVGFYRSHNHAVASSYSTVKLTFAMATDGIVRLQYVSDGESSYDYLAVSKIDPETDLTDSTLSTAEYTTKSNQKTVYTREYGLSAGRHTLQIMFRKDSSSNVGTDSGYYRITTEYVQGTTRYNLGLSGSFHDTYWSIPDTMTDADTLGDNLYDAFDALVSYLNDPCCLWTDGTTEVSDTTFRDTLMGLVRAYYAQEDKVKAAVPVSDYEYLKNAFKDGSTEYSGGVVMSECVAVKDSDGNVQAALNGSDTFSDTTHGKIILAGGIPEGDTTLSERINDATTIVYEDGTVKTGSLSASNSTFTGTVTATEGKIAGFKINGNTLTATLDSSSVTLNPEEILFSTTKDKTISITSALGDGVLPGVAGIATGMGAVVNDSSGQSDIIIAGYFSASGAIVNSGDAGSGAHALYLESGDIAGFRPASRIVTSSSTTEQKILSHLDTVVIVNNSSSMTLTLPASPQPGQMYIIPHLTTSTVTVTGSSTYKIYRPDNNSATTTTTSTAREVILIFFEATSSSAGQWIYTFIKP